MCLLAEIELTQTLQRSRDRAAQTLILTYLDLICKSLNHISELQGLEPNSQRPFLLSKLRREK